MKSNVFLKWILSILIFTTACKKDKEIFPEYTSQTIKISYSIDSLPLLFDTLMYNNAAGNNYEINRLEYYISNIIFHSSYGNDYTSSDIYYVDAKNSLINSISIDSVPSGQYSYITFNIGLDPKHNLTGYLPNTSENINMAWPVSMGGGYHFMKFEGHYVFPPSTSGFAVHLGKNPNIVNCLVNQCFLTGYPPYEIRLNMNISEWFKNPYTYDFNVDGSYTMSNMNAMSKIALNGADVFMLR